MTGFKSLFDAGHLSIVNGVGYPNPNRSHFRATEIWQTASDEDKYLTDGWLGRYFDNACQGCDPTVGDQHRAAAAAGLCLAQSDRHQPGKSAKATASWARARTTTRSSPTAACTIRTTPLPGEFGRQHQHGFRHGHAAQRPERARFSGTHFHGRAGQLRQNSRHRRQDEEHRDLIPTAGWRNNLQLVARLIAGGLPTRVFYVSQGGYDTHTNQRGGQDARLKELGEAVKAFTDDLTAMGEFDRVMIMTFSEFGRRVTENGSRGTDHGAAAPMFLIGSKLKAGLLGAEPSLAPADLQDGDIKLSTPTSAASTPPSWKTGSRRRPRRFSAASSTRCRFWVQPDILSISSCAAARAQASALRMSIEVRMLDRSGAASSPPRPCARWRETEFCRRENAGTAISLAALSTAGSVPPVVPASRARRSAGKRSGIGRFESERAHFREVERLEAVRQPVGIGHRVLDREAHVGMAQLRELRAVDEFDQRMDDALRMHDHVDLLHRHAEKPARLDHLQALVEKRGRIDGDLAAHVPGRMLERLRGRDAAPGRPRAFCGTGRPTR